MSIKVKYIYSACIIIETEDCKILCDPWFTEGAYDGSWFHFPKIDNPLKLIGEVDFIYVSHIHPDHYDPDFIKKYFNKFGEHKILISDHNPNYLSYKMRGDGLIPTIIDEKKGMVVGNTIISILPHDTGSISDIDSAISVKYKNHKKENVVLNVNDIIMDAKFIKKLGTLFPSIDILLCGYTGAGPYPQTYFSLNDEILIEEANRKKGRFFDRYKELTSALNAKVNIPFAGKYLLGGKLAKLNDYRGVADAVEVLDFDKNAIVLDDGKDSFIDTQNFIPSQARTKKYTREKINKRIDEIKNQKMDYERLINKDEVHKLPLNRIILKSYKNAIKKSEVNKDYFFVFNLESQICIVNANKNNEEIKFIDKKQMGEMPTPRSEIIIDERYFFGLMTLVYHWNNAEVGSQFMTRRTPNDFNRKAQGFLNFFTI
tara:strand:+ start:685 stop:1971 length:1287 start_codon:yes stop_codon:yes gene_type:complete